MEVHHHPHVEKKRFKEYFLEFIMIFLAVSLGFFAESIRESISNGERARSLTRQLVKDVKTDSVNLDSTIHFFQRQTLFIDSLYNLLQAPLANADIKGIQSMISHMYSIKIFNPSIGAISAIEKELHLKQFVRSELPGLIAEYESRTNIVRESQSLLMRLDEQNVEPFIYAHFTPAAANSIFGKDSLPSNNLMRNLTQENMAEMSVKIEVIKSITGSLILLEEKMKSKAGEMLEYVNQHFHPGN